MCSAGTPNFDLLEKYRLIFSEYYDWNILKLTVHYLNIFREIVRIFVYNILKRNAKLVSENSLFLCHNTFLLILQKYCKIIWCEHKIFIYKYLVFSINICTCRAKYWHIVIKIQNIWNPFVYAVDRIIDHYIVRLQVALRIF